MNRSLTSLFAAFEALLVALIGIGIPLAPLTVLWAFQYGFAIDWSVFWRASADIWLLGHGTDITFTLDAATARAAGLAGAGDPFTITIAVLGFALLTALLGARAGRRIAETDHRLLGEAVAIGVFALIALLVTLSTKHPLATPSTWQGVLFPTLVFALGILIGTVQIRPSENDDTGSAVREWIDTWRPHTRATVFGALRGGLASVAVVVAVASITVTALIFTHYATIIRVYEELHTEVLGGASITIAQLAILPNLVIWCASWFVGPGFAIGTGSSVSPLATVIGPIPPIPVFGALPAADSAFGFVGILVPVVAAFMVGALMYSRVAPQDERAPSLLRLAITGAGMGIIGGIALGLLAWFSGGAAGPGRLVDVGPEVWSVAGWAALEIGVAAILGLFAARRLPDLVPTRPRSRRMTRAER